MLYHENVAFISRLVLASYERLCFIQRNADLILGLLITKFAQFINAT